MKKCMSCNYGTALNIMPVIKTIPYVYTAETKTKGIKWCPLKHYVCFPHQFLVDFGASPTPMLLTTGTRHISVVKCSEM